MPPKKKPPEKIPVYTQGDDLRQSDGTVAHLFSATAGQSSCIHDNVIQVPLLHKGPQFLGDFLEKWHAKHNG